MSKLAKIVAKMRDSPHNVTFAELRTVCDHYFERRSTSGGDHFTYKTPWRGDPRINIQPSGKSGKESKDYQVKQVLRAIDLLDTLRPNGRE